ncbi:FtsK SpoIIIE family protein [Lactobacillus crispatus]|uniref:hypothetical protein n=1 Tax=Lactobacillus crispatus TaxID=47770 RepID=UPI0018E34B0F|nr:hypothetical protein [Lactobacillus crispatus]MBI1700519.1 FtsK SpoIIIE family protein [Lactobacillus crispatus]
MYCDKKPYVSGYRSALDAIATYEPMIRSAIDAKMSNGDSSVTNNIGVDLYVDKCFIYLNEPSETTLDLDFKNQIERILTTLLYPEWVVKHRSGLNLVARTGDGVGSANARALKFDLHWRLYDRLVLRSLGSTTTLAYNDQTNSWEIPLMTDYNWNPITSPHVAVSGLTGSGKTMQLIILNSYAKNWADQIWIEDPRKAAPEKTKNPNLIIIDPKGDSKMREYCVNHGFGSVEYLAPDLTQNQAAFLARANEALKRVVEVMNYRYSIKSKYSNVKFRHLFVTVDEMRALLEGGNKKAIDAFFELIDLITLKGRAAGIHLICGSQSFLAGKSDGCISTPARDNLTLRILLSPTITAENARFLFKEIDKNQAESLIIDTDGYDCAGVGIISNTDRVIVPYKVPFLGSVK